MKFEEKSPEVKAATFEVIDWNNFTEYAVAISALGFLTAKYANDETKRLQPARLATQISYQAGKVAEKEKLNKKDQPADPQPITIDLSSDEAHILHEALDLFTENTPSEITRLVISDSSHRANVRAVEADIAKGMLENIKQTFNLPATGPNNPSVGFR